MVDSQLNESQFVRRVAKIQESISMPLLTILGKKLEVEDFGSNSALFIYLLNYEFPETLLLITKDMCYAVTSTKKKEILESMQCAKLRVYERMKDGSSDSFIRNELTKIADSVLLSEKNSLHGHFCSTYISAFKTVDFEMGNLFIQKEEEEIEYVECAALFVTYLMEEAIKMVRKGEVCVESKLERHLDTPNKPFDLKLSQVEFTYSPRIVRDEDAVTISIGVRYQSYCAEIQRVLFYDADYLEIYRKRNEKIRNRNFENLKSLGLLQREGLRKDEDGTFVMKTDHENYTIVDVVKCTDGKFEVLTDDITWRESEKKNFVAEDFLIEREKTNIEKKRLSRQKALEKEIEINEHQKELMDKLNDEMVRYYSDMETTEPLETMSKKLVAYEKESQLPRKNKLVIDRRNFSILIPINGYMVPFHIEYVKNCSLNGNDLRVNFREGEIIKSITYRSKTANSLYNEIGDAKKEYVERRETSNVGEQGTLCEIKGRRHILGDVKIKTEVRTQKKSRAGNLELHENGFRFGDTTILFNNIEHLFYQQGDVYLLHFKLALPIIFNGKKAYNVQFFKEVVENMSIDIMKLHPSQKERLEEEQEKIRLEMVKAEYDNFIKNVENNSNLRIDRVSKDVYFEGVPYRQNVQIRPSSTCLVNLLEPPFLIVDFEKMEVANFERVNYVSRSFDLTFIFKDKTFITITSVDSRSMDYLREFIDSRNICFIQTAQNINWNNLLKTIKEDPFTFYNDGGWSALQPMREDNDQEESSASTLSSPSSVSEATMSDTEGEDESLEEEIIEEDDDDDIVDLNDIDSEDESEEDDEQWNKKRRI